MISTHRLIKKLSISNFQINKPVLKTSMYLYGFLVCIAWLVRIVLYVNKGIILESQDVLGFFSDALISALITPLILLCMRIHWSMQILACMLWGLIHHIHYEHVIANDDLISIFHSTNALHTSFILGSGTVYSNKILFFVLLVFPFCTLGLRRVKIAYVTLFLSLVLSASLLTIHERYIGLTDGRWRVYHVLHGMGYDFHTMMKRKKTSQKSIPIDPDSLTSLRKDLNGTLILPQLPYKPNILLIVLESVCGSMLPSLQKYHSIYSQVTMPHLDSIAQNNITYANFTTNQRQTNRGLFCILSGNYPKLNSSTPKMTETVALLPTTDSVAQLFIPGYLKTCGYSTTYAQGSHLSYMMKDAFMKQIGFDSLYGAEWFTTKYAESFWGVDDKAFFEQLGDFISKKNQLSTPWFVTALTVGTHHPATVPDIDTCPDLLRRTCIAYHYLDDALGQFISQLKDKGILDSTVVLITCDESAGTHDYKGNQWIKHLTQQWGMLVVIHPQKTKKLITQQFCHLDLSLSLADINKQGLPSPFWGRSILRSYKKNRDIYFANTYFQLSGRFIADSAIEVCDEKFLRGVRFSHEEKSIISLIQSSKTPLAAASLNSIETASSFCNNYLTSALSSLHRHMNLAKGATYAIRPGEQYTLLAGQNITIPGNSAVSVTLAGHILEKSNKKIQVYIKHDLVSYSGLVHISKYMPVTITAADTFVAEYQFYTYRTYKSVDFRLTAELMDGKTATIVIDSANLTIDTRNPTETEKKQWNKPFNLSTGRDVGSMKVFK